MANSQNNFTTHYGNNQPDRYEPVSWFGVFMLAVATSLLPPNRGTEISLLPKTAALDCVKQILIYTNSPDAPALFGGIASTNLERVKLFLDYSAYFTGLADAGWSQSRRIELAAFEPFEKDIRYEAIVVSRTSETLKWGNRPGDKDIIGSGKYRARLAFAAPGGEQYFYFMLVPTYISAGRRDVIILNQDDFSFQHEWEGT